MIESRFDQEKQNIANQILESRRRAEQKIANELRQEQEELYAKIKHHNSEVKKFDRELGLKSVLKKLAVVEEEFKALAHAENYLDGKN